MELKKKTPNIDWMVELLRVMDAVCCKLDLQASWTSRMTLMHHMFHYRITDCSGVTLNLYDTALVGHRRPRFPIDTISLAGESSCERWHEHGTAHLFIGIIP
jgi:hypothetical protein